MTQYVIAMDVGGSSVKSGVVDSAQTVTHVTHTDINAKGSADEIFGTMTAIIQQHQALVASDTLLGVGFGFPSPFDYEQGIAYIKGLEKYEGIYSMNVGAALRERLNAPSLTITFRNDAEAAIVGEAIYGAGKAYTRLIGITLGTGLGSSFVVDGKRIASGAGIPEGGFLFPEMYGNGRADDLFSTRGLLSRFEAANLNVGSVADAAQAADAGDDAVLTVFAAFGHDLGDFLKPYATKFGAEALIVLGGISGAMAHFEAALESQLGDVAVQRGSLGRNAALLGAAEPLFRIM